MSDIDPRLTEITDGLYRVAAKAVIIHDHRLLMVRETEGWYSLPGGGIEFGESVTVTLQRELEEEIGILATDIIVTPQIIHYTLGEIIRRIPRCQLYFAVKLLHPDAVRNHELSFKWVSRSELKDLEVSPAIDQARPFLLGLL